MTELTQSEEFAKDVAQELHDQFVINGKNPEEVHEWVLGAIKAYKVVVGDVTPATAKEQDVCPDCGSTAQRMRGCAHQDHGKKTHALIRYECIRCTNSWHTLSAAEFYKYYYDRFLVVGDPGTFESAHQRVFRFAEAYAARLGEK